MPGTSTVEAPSSTHGQLAVESPARIASIDILRAITMVLMIFVNDLWSLTNIPVWLLHTTAEEDGMGLSDVVFPAFLFIVGMSIPFAVNSRRRNGDGTGRLLLHIVLRSAALLVMGAFLVNGENLNSTATGMPRLLYNVLVCTSFILVWNAYPETVKPGWVWWARALGAAMLVTLAFLVRGGDGGVGFTTYWWGILGLIGWAYLVCSLLFVFLGHNLVAMTISWVVMITLSMAAKAELISLEFMKFVMEPLSNGSLPFLTMGGILISMLFLHFKSRNEHGKVLAVCGMLAAVLLAAGFYTNQFWPIAKLGATPPWVLICSAITILVFIPIYWLADLKKKASWFNLIKPAGSNTLLTYFIPFFAYAFVGATAIHWPDFMLSGVVGLAKSLAFAFLCVVIAGFLENRRVRVKL